MRMISTIAVATLVLSVVGSAAALDTPSDEELLRSMDGARFLSSASTTLDVEVMAETPDEVSTSRLKLMLREEDDESYVRIEFQSPEELAGQVFLSVPSGTYFWQPELFEPIRTSATQVAFGDAPVAQISGVRFEGNYSVESRSVVDNSALWKLELDALRPDVAFQSLAVFVDPESLHPQELLLYSATDALLYTVIVESYEELEGDLYAQSQLVENALIEGNTTRLTILEARIEELPRELFDPDELGDDDL
ncbi:MAG: outer membrane lipoprotein-sorting protein [Candidatus Bipolaricaulota bacterium]